MNKSLSFLMWSLLVKSIIYLKVPLPDLNTLHKDFQEFDCRYSNGQCVAQTYASLSVFTIQTNGNVIKIGKLLDFLLFWSSPRLFLYIDNTLSLYDSFYRTQLFTKYVRWFHFKVHESNWVSTILLLISSALTTDPTKIIGGTRQRKIDGTGIWGADLPV